MSFKLHVKTRCSGLTMSFGPSTRVSDTSSKESSTWIETWFIYSLGRVTSTEATENRIKLMHTSCAIVILKSTKNTKIPQLNLK